MNLVFKKLEIFNCSLKLLNNNEKLKLLLLSLLSFISALLEIVSVLSVYPFINIILNEDLIITNNKYKYIWELFNTPSIGNFIVYLAILF